MIVLFGILGHAADVRFEDVMAIDKAHLTGGLDPQLVLQAHWLATHKSKGRFSVRTSAYCAR